MPSTYANRTLDITPPVKAADLQALPEGCRGVTFASGLKESEYKLIADFVAKYPQTPLRINGYWDEPTPSNLKFLGYFSKIKNLSLNQFDVTDISALNELPETLESLSWWQTKSKKFSLNFLKRLRKLRHLSLEGHDRDIGVISELVELESLSLRSITLPNLKMLSSLKNLLSFELKLGGTTNLTGIEELPRLRYLEIWQVKGLSNLEPLGCANALQFLFLENLSKVTKLPNLKKLSNLRRVDLFGLKQLKDLKSLSTAPSLEILLYSGGSLSPLDFKCLVGHPKLKEVGLSLGSQAKTKQTEEILNLKKSERSKWDFEYA